MMQQAKFAGKDGEQVVPTFRKAALDVFGK